MRGSRWVAGVAVLGLGCGGGSGDAADATPPPVDHVCAAADSFLCGSPRNIAHRGGGALAPENTLPAFVNAIAVGADILELDVRRTADNVVVLMHDPSVDRTTDGTGAVATKTLAELQALDAGYRFTPDDGATFPFRGTGVTAPTLDAVLAALPDAYFMIEIKDHPATIAPVLALLDAHAARDRVVIASFYDDLLAEVRATAPDVLTSMGVGEQVAFQNLSPEDEATYGVPAPFLQPPLDLVTDPDLERAQRHALLVHVWTVNDPVEMADLLARGAHGIITDDPRALRDVLDPP